MTLTRQTTHFSGHVQGVGFRWTARRVAGGFAVTGTVENLPDGRVRLVLEGDADACGECRDAIAAAMADHITAMPSEDEPIEQRTHRGFRILR